ncbi:MAG TPA: RNA polymerase sigma factor [Blastocatellia bacterium]|nr:RNA polymerase sigma factor [Blastocatellia bacterium]
MVRTAAITVAATSMTDEEVIKRVKAGETALFEVIMRRYNQRLYRVVRSILCDDGEAEDVTQDAYVRSYTHLDQFDGRAKFSTWLTKIAVNEALARLRNRQRLVDIDAASISMEDGMNLESKSPSPEQEVLTHTIRIVLEAAVDKLPENYRSVFMLRDVEGMSTAETADCLDLSEESIKVRLHRARSLLRKHIYAQTGAATTAAFQFMGARCDCMVSAVLERIEPPEAPTPD